MQEIKVELWKLYNSCINVSSKRSFQVMYYLQFPIDNKCKRLPDISLSFSLKIKG